MYTVHITEPAEQDITEAFAWWRDNRSAEQASRWLDNIYPAIATLVAMPQRCPLCDDSPAGGVVCRQLLYGVGRTNTHRIVFTIDGDMVVVLRVLHGARAES